jgi:hypothetical protein
MLLNFPSVTTITMLPKCSGTCTKTTTTTRIEETQPHRTIIYPLIQALRSITAPLLLLIGILKAHLL